MKKSKTSKSEKNQSKSKQREDFLIVGIGASAGGVQALKDFFENVPADSGMAYVVILHLSPDHDSQLSEVLQSVACVPVSRVKEEVRVEPNHVYVVPPNQSLSMRDGSIIVSPIHTVEERRAPVDIFFRTLAESHGERAVAVVLSGTGANGSMGLKRVKEKGGAAFVQNPREAEFNEMPRSSIATDLVDQILNVAEIPAKIIAYRDNLGKIEIPLDPEKLSEEEHQQALLEILMQLRVRTGHDFTNYKRATVLRRLARRINVCELADLPAYAAYLRDRPEETQSLLKDLLISVTNFFRDKEPFDYLERDVIPEIFRGKTSTDKIRVWAAGCATGEEAYSLAMFLAERAGQAPDAPSLQIFATDIDEVAVAQARDGFYTLNDAADVSPERLKRFFTKENDGYRVRRELREMILFADHNVIKDPPFSRLDLVTCRNMLIYLNAAAQKRVMETFHFSLKPGGYLFLGNSETTDGAGDLYAPVSREHHVYQSRQAAPRMGYPVPDALSPSIRRIAPNLSGNGGDEPETNALKRISYGELHQQMLEQYTPSLVVNEEYDIVHMSESSLQFLQMTAGEPTPNLLRLIRPELRLELRAALYQAAQHQTNVEVMNLKLNGGEREEVVNIFIRPILRQTDTARGFILVLFENVRKSGEETETVYRSDEPIARQLETELIRSQKRLRSSGEQYEAQAEELKASNEELQAMNEELRSSSEELETGKEELQSLNEELSTVNQELKIKIEEISQTSNNLDNLITSTDIGTIFLDRAFRVQLFTPTARKIFNLIPADLGRPLSDISNRLENIDLVSEAKTVLEKLHTVEREVRGVDGRTFMLRVLPFRTKDDKINGVVLTFYDITELKRAEVEKFLLASIVESSQDSMITINFDRIITSWNKAAEELYGYPAKEAIGKPLTMLTLPEDLLTVLSNIDKIKVGEKVKIFDTIRVKKDGQEMNLEIVLSPVKDVQERIVGVSTIARDVTARGRAEANLQLQSQLLDTVGQSVIATDLDGVVFYWNRFAEKLYGWSSEEAEGRSILELTTPAIMAQQAAEIMSNLKQGKSWSGEFNVQRRDGTIFPAQVFNSPVFDEKGNLTGIVGVSTDISERKRLEKVLLESEERLRLLIESVSDYAIFTLSLDSRIEFWNTGAEKIFGWTESEAVGQSGEIIFTPEDRAKGAPEEEIKTARRTGRAPDERFHLRKDGSRFYVSGVMMLLKDADGKARGFVKIARDMTEQLEAEKALQDKEILQRIVGAQEDERRRIARDLHDELGQQLTVLRMKLDAAKRLCEDDELCGKIEDMEQIAKTIDNGVDFLAWELRPAALDDLGLIAALDNYVKQWSHHSGVRVELLASSLKKTRFAPEVETNLYRIVQEALNNVHKYAEAKSVEIMLEKREDLIVLLIEDNGSGFNLKDKKKLREGMGIIGMKERAALIGGTFEIESAPGKGTTIFVRFPASTAKRRKSDEK